MKNSKIKKKIGEKAFNFLIRNFPEDILVEKLSLLFGKISDVRNVKEDDLQILKEAINKTISYEKSIEYERKSVKEILFKKGYSLNDSIRSIKDYSTYLKYYKKGESLCKFKGYDATKRYHKVFFLEKKGFKSLQRNDFLGKEGRQDEYSTSLLSVAISSDKKNISQICSRYNHTVAGCDNVFSSNLEKIAPGLTDAFNREYSLCLSKNTLLELQNFYVHNEKYFFYSHEIEGVKIGNNTVDGVIYDPDRYIVFDYLVLDMKEKKIRSVIENTKCGAIDLINERLDNGAKIRVINGDIPHDFKDQENILFIFKK